MTQPKSKKVATETSRQPEQEQKPEVVEDPSPAKEEEKPKAPEVEVQDKKEEDDLGLDLVADECLNLNKKKSQHYKQEQNDVEMQDESVNNTNSM